MTDANAESGPAPAREPEPKFEPKSEAKPQAKPESKSEAKTEPKSEAKTEAKIEAKPEAKSQPTPAGEPDAGAVIEALNTENAQLKDRVLRTLAEMENLRRRTEREVADAKLYGVTSLARDMLTVVDNLARAIEHVPAEARAAADQPVKPFLEGIELTARDLEAALGRHGVKKLDPAGQKFDPHFHQAIYEAPDEAVPAGSVAKVVQSGWTIGERVLRPAMVGVSKGPTGAPKPASPAKPPSAPKDEQKRDGGGEGIAET